jgi:hypothetical protein
MSGGANANADRDRLVQIVRSYDGVSPHHVADLILAAGYRLPQTGAAPVSGAKGTCSNCRFALHRRSGDDYPSRAESHKVFPLVCERIHSNRYLDLKSVERNDALLESGWARTSDASYPFLSVKPTFGCVMWKGKA